MRNVELVPADRVEQAIVLLRGYRVMLDADLAALYGVETKALLRAVKRNPARFPKDFAFELTRDEKASLKREVAATWGGRRYQPYAFTEQGVAMLSSVLRSTRAIEVNVEIMRAFVRLRQLLQGNAELARKLEALEARYDKQFHGVFDAIRKLMAPPDSPKKRIGFETEGG